jgi:uncharacterized protein
MRLDLRNIIHVPEASKSFQFQMDLSGLEFYGEHLITRPVQIEGSVTNHAGALVLEGTASSLLDLVCDRCGKKFSREKVVELNCLLAAELEDEENDEIYLLEGNEVDLDEVAGTAFILAMDTKNLCSDNCKGLCAKCGADLNNGPCGCRPEVDPRLAALAQLLDD